MVMFVFKCVLVCGICVVSGGVCGGMEISGYGLEGVLLVDVWFFGCLLNFVVIIEVLLLLLECKL